MTDVKNFEFKDFTLASHHFSAADILASFPVQAAQFTPLLHIISKNSLDEASDPESDRPPKIPIVSLPAEEFPVVVVTKAVVVVTGVVVAAVVVTIVPFMSGFMNVGGTQLVTSSAGGTNDHNGTEFPEFWLKFVNTVIQIVKNNSLK